MAGAQAVSLTIGVFRPSPFVELHQRLPSRISVTSPFVEQPRTDSGGNIFNVSEVGGAGAAAAISDLYYPGPERTWTKTYQRWLLNASLDGMTDVFREFWPDINHAIFHSK
jgi:hypothetical protein